MMIKRTNKRNCSILKAARVCWFHSLAVPPFPGGAGPPASGWGLPPGMQQVEGDDMEGMVPGEGITCEEQWNLSQSEIRDAATRQPQGSAGAPRCTHCSGATEPSSHQSLVSSSAFGIATGLGDTSGVR